MTRMEPVAHAAFRGDELLEVSHETASFSDFWSHQKDTVRVVPLYTADQIREMVEEVRVEHTWDSQAEFAIGWDAALDAILARLP